MLHRGSPNIEMAIKIVSQQRCQVTLGVMCWVRNRLIRMHLYLQFNNILYICDLEGRSDDCDPAVQLYDAGRSDRVAGAVSGCTGVAIHVTQEAKAGPGHDCCREAAKGVFKYPRARSCGRSYYSISDMRYSHIVGPSGHLHV